MNNFYKKGISNQKVVLIRLIRYFTANQKPIKKNKINKKSLIKNNDEKLESILINKRKKEIFANKIHYLRHTNIKFNPCIYNLFNVPVIENNNSLKETIKRQTVSNFNNKYNIKFKTKNPKEKEKIKILFDLLQKHKNIEIQRSRDLRKYNSNSIKKNERINIEDNKSSRANSGNINQIKIDNYFSERKLGKFLNKNINI